MILPVLLLCSLASKASPKSTIPFFNTSLLIISIKNAPVEKNDSKICACQLLDVKSTNENLKNLVVFAEKTNKGDFANERKVARTVIQKEKKKMKTFYSEIRVTREVVVKMDCSSLYKQLKSAYGNLKVFGTLDADIKTAIK